MGDGGRFWRFVLGSEPSALERLASDYPAFLRTIIRRWMLILGAGTFSALLVIGPNPPGFQFARLLPMAAGMWGATFLALAQPVERTHRAVALLVFGVGALFGLAFWQVGPNFGAIAASLPLWVVACFATMRHRTAALVAIVSVISTALVLVLADGYPRPAGQLLFLGGVVLAGMDFFSRVSQELEGVADRLEARVEDQGHEIERLGQLRRFLTPQIAESVLSGDADTLLSTHRRRIAVFFCDLRGFTRFSSTAEPEDIAEVLNEYYEVLGHAIETHEATIGGFAGDGIWAFFNDPFPVEDPAGRAFSMALSLREPMRAMQHGWERRGFSLSYGLGIAYGYATLSTIGFESRSEYTAVGTVVNLGARLCDKAGPGELLIDARAYNELPTDVSGTATQLMLKGFNDPVTAYRIAL